MLYSWNPACRSWTASSSFFAHPIALLESFLHSPAPKVPAVMTEALHACSKMAASFWQSGSNLFANSLQASTAAALRPVHAPAARTFDPSAKIMLHALSDSQHRSATRVCGAWSAWTAGVAVLVFRHVGLAG